MDPEQAVAAVVAALTSLRGSWGNEDGLQAVAASALERWSPEREVRLGSGRIDILVRSLQVGVEVKVAEPASAVARQLARYAESPEVAGLVLLTTRFTHRGIEGRIAGKPVRVVWLSPL